MVPTNILLKKEVKKRMLNNYHESLIIGNFKKTIIEFVKNGGMSYQGMWVGVATKDSVYITYYYPALMSLRNIFEKMFKVTGIKQSGVVAVFYSVYSMDGNITIGCVDRNGFAMYDSFVFSAADSSFVRSTKEHIPLNKWYDPTKKIIGVDRLLEVVLTEYKKSFITI